MTEYDSLRVVAAAVLIPEAPGQERRVFSIPAPARHHHVVHDMDARGFPQRGDHEQGFLLSDGRFVSRKAAAGLAVKSGQIERPRWPPDLYSEDLW